MKHIKIILSLVFMSLSLYALDVEKNKYIGVGFTNGFGTQSRNYHTHINFEQNTNGIAKTQYDTSGINLKIGFITNRKDRIEVSFISNTATKTDGNKFNINTYNKEQSKTIGINFDYLLTLGKNKKFLPYLSLGYGIYKNNDIEGYNLETLEKATATGLSLNAGVGLIYEMIKNVGLEVSYKIKGIGYNVQEPSITESIKMAYLGVNFKF